MTTMEIRAALRLARGDVKEAFEILSSGGKRVTTRRPAKYDIFLSHTGADKWDALVLYIALRALGARVFFDVKDIGGGVEDDIKDGLSNSARFLALVSKEYMTRKWPVLELKSFLKDSGRKRITAISMGLAVDDLVKLGDPIKGANQYKGYEKTIFVDEPTLGKMLSISKIYSYPLTDSTLIRSIFDENGTELVDILRKLESAAAKNNEDWTHICSIRIPGDSDTEERARDRIKPFYTMVVGCVALMRHKTEIVPCDTAISPIEKTMPIVHLDACVELCRSQFVEKWRQENAEAARAQSRD